MPELRDQAYALESSGHVLVPGALSQRSVRLLRAASARALRAVRAALVRGQPVSLQPHSPYYVAASGLYCWSAEALRLLQQRQVLALADLLLEDYRLNDLSVFSALPGPADGATTSWHRDCHDFDEAPGHLWFFFYLDDFTTRNGATWIVPGSHRGLRRFEPALGRPWKALDVQHFPSARQLLGKAGDLVIIDARALHSSGRNLTRRARRMINLGLVHASRTRRIRVDHWTMAGPDIRSRASPALRRLLGADEPRRRQGMPSYLLPPGWRVSD